MPLLFAIFIISSFLVSCSDRKDHLKLVASSKGATYYNAANALSEVLSDDGYKIEVLSGPGYSTIPNLQMISKKEADLAFVQNDTPVEAVITKQGDLFSSKNVRTILPVYPEILFIVYPDSLSPHSLKDLVCGRRIGIGPRNSGTAEFMRTFFTSLGIDSSEYIPVHTNFENNLLSNPAIDISCSITGFNNSRITKMLNEENGAIFNLDNYKYAFKGSAVDGFCFNYPRAKPFIIPKRTFGEQPAQPILTIAVDALLVTHKDSDENMVYDLVEQVFSKSQHLTNKNVLYGFLTEDFDPARLNFPLHEGVKMYLERDEPTFYERYAELIGVSFSILLVLAGGISSLVRRKRIIQKNRLDSYYTELLQIENQINNYRNQEDINNIIQHIRIMKNEVYLQMVEEKIPADQSFSHFILLANEIIRRLEPTDITAQDS